MNIRLDADRNQCGRSVSALLMLLIAVAFPPFTNCQTSSTGALTGVSLDPSGTLLPGAAVRLANLETGAIESAVSDEEGRFNFPLLRPGGYQVQGRRRGADDLVASATVNVHVTETIHLQLHFQLATLSHIVDVVGEPTLVQTDSLALGRVVNETAVRSLFSGKIN